MTNTRFYCCGRGHVRNPCHWFMYNIHSCWFWGGNGGDGEPKCMSAAHKWKPRGYSNQSHHNEFMCMRSSSSRGGGGAMALGAHHSPLNNYTTLTELWQPCHSQLDGIGGGGSLLSFPSAPSRNVSLANFSAEWSWRQSVLLCRFAFRDDGKFSSLLVALSGNCSTGVAHLANIVNNVRRSRMGLIWRFEKLFDWHGNSVWGMIVIFVLRELTAVTLHGYGNMICKIFLHWLMS